MTDPRIEVAMQRDCLGGERVVELLLPRPVDEAGLSRVHESCSPLILRGLPRAFFRLDVPGAYLLSGIIGDRKVRFTVRLAARERALELSLHAAQRMLEGDRSAGP